MKAHLCRGVEWNGSPKEDTARHGVEAEARPLMKGISISGGKKDEMSTIGEELWMEAIDDEFGAK